jgi:UDP-N-acetylmuramate dehydrogenase
MALDPDTRKWLSDRFGDSVRFGEPMARHTRLRIGGPADAYLVPETGDAVQTLLLEARDRKLPLLAIGAGTNLLVRDGGIPGVVFSIHRSHCGIRRVGPEGDGVLIEAGGGAGLPALLAFALSEGLAGMNFAVGIPGSVGGGIRMNAGTFLGAIGDALESVEILLATGEARTIPREGLRFSYRRFSWEGSDAEHGAQGVIVSGIFNLMRGEKESLRREFESLLKYRKERQPLEFPSAGSFFRNPVEGLSAGELIERAGLKGKRVGDAEVSVRHANWIVNRGAASAADVLKLAAWIRETVAGKFGVDLEPEVKIVGE